MSSKLRVRSFAFLCALAFFASAPVLAKDLPVTGVLLFQGPGGPAYAQVSGLLINGKTELRVCSAAGPMDKSGYKSLPKLTLANVRSLKRMPDGSLSAVTTEASLPCVVPSNYKFEKAGSMSASDLVDASAFTAQVLGSSPAGTATFPGFARNSEFIFGSTDRELAEYLRASHAASIPLLRTYIAANPTGAHAGDGRRQLAQLLLAEGTQQLAAYTKTASSPSPNILALKGAREDAEAALAALPGDAPAASLKGDVQTELKAIVAKGSADLVDYRKALADGKPGYSKLVQATELSKAATTVDPASPAATALASDVAAQNRSLESAIANAQTQIAGGQYETALAALKSYKPFEAEDPDLGKIFDAVYAHYLTKGEEAATQNNWADAVEQLKRAAAVKDTPDVETRLTAANSGLRSQQDKVASTQALTKSEEYANENDPIHAYEVLADLPAAQRALVQDQMTALEAPYIKAATAKAQQLQQTHNPMRGRADEDAMRQAYEYYRRCSEISDDEEIKVKLDLLAEQISTYYVGLGKRYMDRAQNSEVGLGWEYMTEALQYRNNLEEVRDVRANNQNAYQIRARLSLGVLFRDQTSRRESVDFTNQMQQAFATGIESANLPVKVFLPGTTRDMKPNFQFVGDVLQHRTVRTPKRETLQSKYRSGSREIPNEAWNKADQAYEDAMLDLQRRQSALTTAQARNNKKQIEQVTAEIDEQQKKVTELRTRMNSLPRTLSEPIISPYNYTRTTLEITNVVELSLRILDDQDTPIGPPIRVIQGETPRKYVILEDIKPDDTEGLKQLDSPPDETQLMVDAEIEARDAIVEAARKAVQELPAKVFARAHTLASSGDNDGAAELYVLYLNSTPAQQSPERTEAARFLSENFNIRHGLTLSASLQ